MSRQLLIAFIVAVILGCASTAAAIRSATMRDVERRFSSMSISAISLSFSSGSERMSPTRFFMKTVEPAPIMAIFVM